jgi:hypothetical protein
MAVPGRDQKAEFVAADGIGAGDVADAGVW